MLDYLQGKHEIQFDTKKFDFRELVVNQLSAVSIESDGAALENLSEVHKLPGIGRNVERYRQVLFSLFREESFQRLYKSFGAYLIDEYFNGVGLIQKTPTVRIQLPGAESTSYHSDGWYGHGETVRSFWMPLTDVCDGNSLYMASDIDASMRCLQEIQNSNASLAEINDLARKVCSAFVGGFGDMLSFSSAMIHGANKNEKDYARVSFDFRIAPNPDDIGNKPITNFYTRNELEVQISDISVDNQGNNATELASITYSNRCRGVSAKAQLMLCAAYADASDISVVGNESEIITLKYMPVLRHYASALNADVNCIILFGLDVFEGDKNLASQIFEIAIDNNVAMVFCAEGLTLSDTESMHNILARF